MKPFTLLMLFSVLSAQAGVVFKYPWKKRVITTCYAQGESEVRNIGVLRTHIYDWSEEEKSTLENMLPQEYSYSRTGISFSGFRDCRNDQRADIILFKARNGGLLGGQASIGQKNPGYVQGYPEARGYVLLYDLNRTNITHEFGHVLGLQHEHLHPDAFTEDPNCLRRILNAPAKRSEHYTYTPYNRQSVMNYCLTSAAGGDDVGLDSEDIRNLLNLYPKD